MAFEIVTECQCELVVEAGFNPARDILSAFLQACRNLFWKTANLEN